MAGRLRNGLSREDGRENLPDEKRPEEASTLCLQSRTSQIDEQNAAGLKKGGKIDGRARLAQNWMQVGIREKR